VLALVPVAVLAEGPVEPGDTVNIDITSARMDRPYGAGSVPLGDAATAAV